MNRVGEVASAVGRGLLAGAAGTAAMTASSTLEMKLRHREASSAPADAAGKVLGIQPRNPAGKARFSNVVHWSYGTGWGAVRGLIGAAGLSGPRATGAHFATIWPGALVMLPSLGVAPPPWKWGATELGIDAMHHLVYVTATSVAYAAISD
ncbi:MAG: hypothetical protein ABIZ50_03905 [Solirubrobacterales bacterium]